MKHLATLGVALALLTGCTAEEREEQFKIMADTHNLKVPA